MEFMLLTIIIIAVAAYLIFKFGLISGKVTNGVNRQGGMRVKYFKLVNHILMAHRDSRVFLETRTYLVWAFQIMVELHCFIFSNVQTKRL